MLFSALLKRCYDSGVQVKEASKIKSSFLKNDKTFLQGAEGEEFGPFDFIVAADGSRSPLRTVGDFTWTKEYAHAAVWSISKNTSVRDELYQVVDGSDTLVGLLPTGGSECSFFWGQRTTEWEALRALPIEQWKSSVLKVCPLAEESLSAFDSFEELTFATYRQVWMNKWFDKKTIFIGDAAHAMSPHLGQGVNFALIDAVTLANVLPLSSSFEDAALRYSNQRRSTVMFYWWLTRMLTPFFQSDTEILSRGRDIFLPLMTKVPWLRNQMLLSMSGKKRGWFSQLL